MKLMDLFMQRQPKYNRVDESVLKNKSNLILEGKVVLLESVQSVVSHLTIPYAIVGGQAVTFHGHPRTTHDIDIFIKKEDLPKFQHMPGASPLTIGGVSVPFHGAKLDVICPDVEWTDALVDSAVETEHGMMVSKPYLIPVSYTHLTLPTN